METHFKQAVEHSRLVGDLRHNGVYSLTSIIGLQTQTRSSLIAAWSALDILWYL